MGTIQDILHFRKAIKDITWESCRDPALAKGNQGKRLEIVQDILHFPKEIKDILLQNWISLAEEILDLRHFKIQ